MYSECENDFKNTVAEVETDAKKYTHFIKRFMNNCKRYEQWVLYKGFDINYRNHNTNNYAEASIRVLKDILLHRTKAYNVVALVDFIVTIGEEYFTLRILNHAHCRHSETNRLYSKLCSNIVDLNVTDVKKISKCTYEVPSMSEKNVYYSINIENGLCTCKMGLSGSFYKHQAWIHKNIKIQLPNAPPITLNERHALGILALGIKKCPKPDFFLGLKENPTVNVLSKTVTCTTQNLDEHNLHKNTSNDDDVYTSVKLMQSDSFMCQNSVDYKKSTGVSNQDSPI